MKNRNFRNYLTFSNLLVIVTPSRSSQFAIQPPRVVSIIRRPNELSVLINRRAEAGSFYAVAVAPFHCVPRAVLPAKDRLLLSWRYLADVRSADDKTLYHILLVLLETVPDLASDRVAGLLPSEWNSPSASARATQAHPRAFRGTKLRPPKPPRIPGTDIRPHLCNLRFLKALLSPLWRFLPGVRSKLTKAGYAVTAVDQLEKELRPSPSRKGPWSLPPQFVQHLWLSVRNGTPREISRHLSLFSKLELDRDPRICGAFTRLIVLAGAEKAYEWGSIAEGLSSHRRAQFLETVIETGAFVSTPMQGFEAQVRETSLLASDEQFANWVEQLLNVGRRGESADYLLAGFRLAAQFYPKLRFSDVRQCSGFPEEVVEEIALLEDSDWIALTLWERCGRFPGFAELIRRSQWRAFVPITADSYFRFLAGIVHCDLPEPALHRKWAAILLEIPRIEALVLAASARYQNKIVEYVSEWLWEWDEPAVIRERLRSGYQVLSRLSAPPFQNGGGAERAIMHFLELESRQNLQRFLAGPGASFEALEKACRRDNDAALIARGLETLTRSHGGFAVDAFLGAPARLCRTAKVLGGVSAPVRSELVRQCREHSIFQIDPLAMPIRDVCAEISAHRRTHRQTNPIPARLSAWFRCEIALSDARLERYRRVLSQRLLFTRLGLIEESVVDWLKRGLPPADLTKAGEHALRLLGARRENRRGLRKFLNAWWAGGHDYLSSHPATLAWYRRHRTVARDIWEQGVPFQSGEYSISVESDPFEVLKLGTYVGSCLGLGGILSDSAVAALLDVNKQVLYARDSQRRVVARQLVAISDDDRLVCFSVYPQSADEGVKSMFREYDHAFAEALNLPLFRPRGKDDGYRVSSVLSSYWWDDLPWNFKVRS